MDFKTVARISTLLSKTFAEDILKLLLMYQNISASEAASRLDLHIKTAQDFLDELNALEIVDKEEVYEKKRPYYRYTLKKKKISIDVDFTTLYDVRSEDDKLEKRIRERKNAGATFTTSGNNNWISSVSVMVGEGRKKKVRKISLTIHQGKFLFYLPFPSADFLSISEIMKKAGIVKSQAAEILDIVYLLVENGIIEIQ